MPNNEDVMPPSTRILPVSSSEPVRYMLPVNSNASTLPKNNVSPAVKLPETFNDPVIITFPFTSNVEFGDAFPMPTPVPLSNIEPVVSVVAPLNLVT